MTTSIEEEVNYTSLIELFGTFFEKVTNSHPQKDVLNKHLSEFKRMLYTNKSNFQKLDTYLDDLKKKTQASVRLSVKQSTDEQLPVPENKKISPKSEVVRSAKRYKTFGPEMSKSGAKSHKFETINVANFIKNRSLEHSNQKQTLLNKYSYVHEFELDSSNFYRLIAIGTIMHLICNPDSGPRLSEIIEDVASYKIALKNYYYSYSHDEYSNVFCGYIEQILVSKKEGKQVQTILQLFQDMVKYDHLFNIALLCYLKGKLIQFVTEQLPKGSWSNQTVWDQLHSPDITEKILNNNPMIFESLLHILPFLLNIRIVTQITENGTLYERSYSKKSLGITEDNNAIQGSSDSFGYAIHLLVEKIFTTSNFYLLVPSEPSFISAGSLASQVNDKMGIDDIKQKYSSKSLVKAPTYPSETKIASQNIYDSPVRQQNLNSNSSTTGLYYRQIETEDALLKDIGNQNLTKNPLNGAKSPRFFMTPSRLKGSSSNGELLKDAPRSEKKRTTTTEYSEIVNGSLAHQLERSNGKENKFTFEKKSPSNHKEPELKDRSHSNNILETRSSVPNNHTSYNSIPNRVSERAVPDRKDEAPRYTKQNDSDGNGGSNPSSLNQFESPYDLYIKTRTQPSSISRPPSDEKTGGALNSKTGSFVYTGNPFNSTPYDNYVSNYNYPNQYSLSSNRLLPSQITSFSTDTLGPTQKVTSGTNIFTAASLAQTSASTANSDSSTIEIIKKFSKLPGEYPNASTENYNSALKSDSDQALRERLKNIGTLAPKANDFTPTNPFSQVSSKNIISGGSNIQNTQDTMPSYNYQTSFNLDPRSITKYGIPYSQETNVINNTNSSLNKPSINENFQAQLSGGISYSYKFTQNFTSNNQPSRYSVNQASISGDNSFTTSALY